MKSYKVLLLVMALVPSYLLNAQVDPATFAETMNLQKAIETAMVNNYDLKIATNTLQEAKNNNSAGNAGLLPSLSLNGGLDYSNTDSELQIAGDETIFTNNNAETMRYNASARIDYTLFDGFGNIYTFDKLKQTNDMQETYFRAQMEATIMEVTTLYYDVCRAQKNLFLAKESMRISKARYDRTKDQRTYGQANQLDLLNAEVDMNTDSTTVLRTEQNFLMTLKNLNVVMAIEVESVYEVDDAITFRDDLTADQALTDAMMSNATLLSQQQMQSISRTDVKITQAAKYPKLTAYGAYGYDRSDSDASQVTYNQNIGPSAGLNLSFNVFNGRQQNTREKNAKLNYLSQQERTYQLKSELERDVSNAYTDYSYKRRIVELQLASMEQAELNFTQTKELFQLGRVTSIEFRTAQQNLLNVAFNYSDAQFTAKVAEYNLLRLTGAIIN